VGLAPVLEHRTHLRLGATDEEGVRRSHGRTHPQASRAAWARA
jgi:hypothetical protein